MTRRRMLLLVLVPIGLLLLAYGVLHLPALQRRVLDTVIERIEAATGWTVAVDEPRLRLWPARFTSGPIELSVEERTIGSVERLEARWGWSALTGDTPRIDEVVVRGLRFDLRDPPELPVSEAESGPEPPDPWRAVEVGRLVVDGTGGLAAAVGIEAAIDELAVTGRLADGAAELTLRAGRVAVTKQSRVLDLGALRIRAGASSAGVTVDEAALEGGAVGLTATAQLDSFDPVKGRAGVRVRAGLAETMGWWDPNLVSGFDPSGVVDLEGDVELAADGEIRAAAAHRGARLRLAGYDIDGLELSFSDEVPEIRLSGDAWGAAHVAIIDHDAARLTADLRRAPVERLLLFAAPEIANGLEGPVSLSGSVDVTLSYPVELERLAAEIDLEIETGDGTASVIGSGEGDRWRVDRLALGLDGIDVRGSGAIAGHRLEGADARLDIDDPSAIKRLATRWFPEVSLPELAGGSINAWVSAEGAIDRPGVTGGISWTTPIVDDVRIESVEASVDGSIDELSWTGRASLEGGVLELDGAAAPFEQRLDGRWRLAVDNLVRVASLAEVDPAAVDGITGTVGGEGELSYSPEGWWLEGRVRAFDLASGGWRADDATLFFALDRTALELSKVTVSTLGGTIVGSASVGLEGLDAAVAADLGWNGIELDRMPLPVDLEGAGVGSGELEIGGTIARPTARIEGLWQPDRLRSMVAELRLAGALTDGVLELMTEEVATGAGALWFDAELPLGWLERPDWLWPDAPDEAGRLRARGAGLRSDAIAELLGYPDPPLSASADLELDASWHPARIGDSRALAEIRGLHIRHVGGEVTADGPVLVSLDGHRVEIAPVALTGDRTRIELGGRIDLDSREVDGRIDGVVSPRIARLVPYPVQISEPIRLTASLGGNLDRPTIGLAVDHRGGALVFREPPLRIRDLVLDAEMVDGVLWFNDGRARVNQGTMEIAGGWDPVSGQGLVAELENVVVFYEGVLTQWSGEVAVEPSADRLALVTGELNLVAGLWDQNVSISSAVFGPDSLDPASDDPLNQVALDLDIRGRGIIRVENNLGRFDARWDVLRVGGTLGRPRINGEVTIDPGGRFNLAGKRVTVRRGNLLFTGDPEIDPIVEIVPESDLAVFGDQEEQVSTTSLATQGLVEGLAGALGFENETLRPAEISVEVEKDSSQQLMLGQRLSHTTALFVATNTTDVQDQTAMLQFWNLPGLEGLALQGYQKTLTEEAGGNIIQRFQWGGSSLYEDRPTIRKLELVGDWPLSKRRLRGSTGFRRGQPYDPFLLFVARVRMERELAGEGYQEARVEAEDIESNNAWKLRFECDPGPRQVVVFVGDEPPGRIRREVTSLYRHPPLERLGFRNMQALLRRHLDAEGYPNAEIVIERRDDRVVVEIDRGAKIDLVGPVLDGVPAPVAEGLVRRLGSPAELALLAEDAERAARIIENVLDDLGYRDAVVRSVQVVPLKPGQAELRVEVDPGSQAVVGELVVEGADPLALTTADDFLLQVGTPLDRLSVDLAASQLRAGYDAAGYSDADVRGSAEQRADGSWRVTIRLEPGIRRVLDQVVVSGLKHTGSRAIAGGVTIEEGEILRNSDLDATAVRVANFAPIERVDVRTVPKGNNRADVELEVTEKPRWTAEVGGGWSTERGAQARFGVRDDNLLGRGLSLNFRGRWDSVEWLGFMVASLPPLPGKRLSFTSTVGFSRGEVPSGDPDFLQDEAFWSIEATRWLGRGERAIGTSGEQLTAYYRYTRTRTYEKDPEPDPFFPIVIDTTLNTSAVGGRYVRDRFDSPFDPTQGYGVVLDGEYADALLGSDLSYWKALASGTMARGVFHSSTWVQSVRIGIAEPLDNQDLIDEVQFFAGGQGSIRGFDRNTVGPVTFGAGGGFEPAGGGALFVLNEELRIPVWGELRAAVFADVGQVWGSWGEADLRLSVGAGIGFRWATPVGPLWADVAWPVANLGISSSSPKYYFGIGRPF